METSGFLLEVCFLKGVGLGCVLFFIYFYFFAVYRSRVYCYDHMASSFIIFHAEWARGGRLFIYFFLRQRGRALPPQTRTQNQLIGRCRPYASPSQKRFMVGFSSPFMRLARHLTALRAWCKQCLPAR